MGGAAAASATEQSAAPAKFQTKTLRGRVVFMAEALQRRFGIKSVDEAQQRLLALEATDGELYPIVADVRGRSFRRDKRLRDIDVELLVRRYEGSPMIQVIRVYELAKDGKYELDYWCEICAIAMFELKACDCCQGPIELRRRLVTKD
jgi:PAS domain-containing protein